MANVISTGIFLLKYYAPDNKIHRITESYNAAGNLYMLASVDMQRHKPHQEDAAAIHQSSPQK